MASALLERAIRLLDANTQTAEHAGTRFRFTVPSIDAYPFQWFWDSCFHAIVWARADWRRAADELAGLFAWQQPSGLIPHVVFWDQSKVSPFAWHYLESAGPGTRIPFSRKPMVTAGIQPPVLALAVERVVEAGAGDAYLAETLPALERYYDYLATARDPDEDGLVSIISQFEGGLDHCPAHDEVVGIRRIHPLALLVRSRLPQVANKLVGFDLGRIFRHFRHHQEDVLVNSVYGDALHALARLAEQAGRPELARSARERARRTTEALLERCYDPRRRLFFNVAGPEERRGSVKTIHSLMPLTLPDLPEDVAGDLVEHLTDPAEFWPAYPVPTVALDEPSFTRNNRVWGFRFITRGPTTMSLNWLLVRGLERHGFHDVAATIRARAQELVERSGFNEFYDPLSGAPVGAPAFGWATLAADLDAEDEQPAPITLPDAAAARA